VPSLPQLKYQELIQRGEAGQLCVTGDQQVD